MNTSALKLLGMLAAILVGVPTVMYSVAQIGGGGGAPPPPPPPPPSAPPSGGGAASGGSAPQAYTPPPSTPPPSFGGTPTGGTPTGGTPSGFSSGSAPTPSFGAPTPSFGGSAPSGSSFSSTPTGGTPPGGTAGQTPGQAGPTGGPSFGSFGSNTGSSFGAPSSFGGSPSGSTGSTSGSTSVQPSGPSYGSNPSKPSFGGSFGSSFGSSQGGTSLGAPPGGTPGQQPGQAGGTSGTAFGSPPSGQTGTNTGGTLGQQPGTAGATGGSFFGPPPSGQTAGNTGTPSLGAPTGTMPGQIPGTLPSNPSAGAQAYRAVLNGGEVSEETKKAARDYVGSGSFQTITPGELGQTGPGSAMEKLGFPKPNTTVSGQQGQTTGPTGSLFGPTQGSQQSTGPTLPSFLSGFGFGGGQQGFGGQSQGATQGQFPGQGQGVSGGFPGQGATQGQFPGGAGLAPGAAGPQQGQFSPPQLSQELQARLSTISKDSRPEELKGDQKGAYLQAIAQSGAVSYGGSEGGAQLAQGFSFQPHEEDAASTKAFQSFQSTVSVFDKQKADWKKALDNASAAGVNISPMQERYDAFVAATAGVKGSESLGEASADIFTVATLAPDVPKLIAEAKAAVKAPKAVDLAEKKVTGFERGIALILAQAEKQKDPSVKQAMLAAVENMKAIVADAQGALEDAKTSVTDGEPLAAFDSLKAISDAGTEIQQELDKVKTAKAAASDVAGAMRNANRGFRDADKQIAQIEKTGGDASGLRAAVSAGKVALANFKSKDPAVKAQAVDAVVEAQAKIGAYFEAGKASTQGTKTGLEEFGITIAPSAQSQSLTKALQSAQNLAPVIVQQQTAGGAGTTGAGAP